MYTVRTVNDRYVMFWQSTRGLSWLSSKQIPYIQIWTDSNLHERKWTTSTHFCWNALFVPLWSRSWQRHATTKARLSLSDRCRLTSDLCRIYIQAVFWNRMQILTFNMNVHTIYKIIIYTLILFKRQDHIAFHLSVSLSVGRPHVCCPPNIYRANHLIHILVGNE
jgi:hypothetical protein